MRPDRANGSTISNPWTETDITLLRDLYGKLPASEVGLRLSRPTCAIYDKAHRLGLQYTRWEEIHDYTGLSDADAGWLAGIIDGEGWIGIDKRSRRATIQVNNTSPEMIQRLSFLCGGSIYQAKKYEAHHKQAYIWCLSRGQNVVGFLAVLIPHLTAKLDAAYRAIGHVSGSKEET